MKNIKLIIFDFDGVIADSFGSFYPMIRDAMASIGLKLSKNDYRNLFIGNIHHGFKDFIKDERKFIKFSKYRTRHYSDYYRPKIFAGSKDFLNKVREQGYKTAICSSGDKETVLKTLATNNIGGFFDLIFATNESTKEKMIKDSLEKFKSKPEESVMITDTVGDIKIAKQLNLRVVAVTWGFNSKELLRSANPDFIAKSFSDLTPYLF